MKIRHKIYFSSFNFKLISIILVLNISLSSCKISSRKLLPHDVQFLEVLMPSVRPEKDDDYLCTGVKATDTESYIVHFEPHADQDRVHHLILYGCRHLDKDRLNPRYWSCDHTSQLCDGMTVMYAWGKNAPALQLPNDVGFRIGEISSINYIVLQVHYAHPLPDDDLDTSGVTIHYTFSPQKYIGGIFLLSSNKGVIPPKQQKYSIDVNCVYDGKEPIYPFAYRVHAHELGVVISGYKLTLENNTWTWTLMAKGNPQLPQAFYRTEQIYTISPNDILVTRCTYNSTNKNMLTSMGSTSHDEMCNLYIMYFAPAKNGRSPNHYFNYCVDKQFDQFIDLPPGSDQPLESSSEVESNDRNEIVYNNKMNFNYKQSNDWPIGEHKFGQITAVNVLDNGNVIIFHRGNHKWNERSFDEKNNYQLIDQGPISSDTIITIDPKTKLLVNNWGSNLFYLPHGLTVDNDFIWLTDVALHQVFKYPINGAQQPLLTLGSRFSPGSTDDTFCKPTSVAVSSRHDEIYVADGYCNSRIIRFSYDGKFLNQWGRGETIGFFNSPQPSSLSIPHKVLFIEDKKLVCVADREHGRIQCFNSPHGQFVFGISRDDFNGRLFSIAYDQTDGGLLFAVCGQSIFQPDKEIIGFVFNISNQELLGRFSPNSGTFSQPHDIAVSRNADDIYVVEIGPNNIWKFSRGQTRKLSSEKSNSRDVMVSKLSSVENLSGTKLIENNHNFPEKDNKSRNPLLLLFSSTKLTIVLVFFVIPILILLIIALTIRLHKGTKAWKKKLFLHNFRSSNFRPSQDKFDFSRLIADPQKQGFNRIPNEEENSENEEENSQSENEEFNANNDIVKKV